MPGWEPPCNACDKPKLHPANIEAWQAYHRVMDQVYAYPVGENKEHVVLKAEAVGAVVRLMQCEDPLETYDRVMLIHRTKYQ